MNNELGETLYYLPLIETVALTVVVTVVFFIINHNFSKKVEKHYWLVQVIIGICFGLCSVFATEIGGINIGGAVINARNAPVLCAGLIFGGPAGLLAGFIGGTERWFSVYWGGGAYTRLACTLGCYLAGVVAALFRKYIFRGFLPKTIPGFFIAVVTEVTHITLIFVTHIDDTEEAFSIVELVTTPMLLATGLCCFVTFLIINSINRSYERKESVDIDYKKKSIAEGLEIRILILILIVFSIAMSFEYVLLMNSARDRVAVELETNINHVYDVHLIDGVGINSNDTLKYLANKIKIGKSGGILVLDNDFRVEAYKDEKDNIIVHKIEIGEISDIEEGKLFEADLDGIKTCCMTKEIGINVLNNTAPKKLLAYMPINEAYRTTYMVMYVTAFLFVILFATLFVLLTVSVNMLITVKINNINTTLTEISKGNLNAEVNERNYYEFNSLSSYINSMVKALKDHIEESKRRIVAELETAKQIQHSALPSVFPPFPNVKSFDIFALMDTAKEVGGDFYDFYFNDADKLYFLIADVSGKGIPGAMFMMKAKSIIKGFAESGASIDEVVTKSNAELCDNNEAEMFVTAFICSIDLMTGMVEYVNAGHNPSIIVKSNGDAEYMKPKVNMVLAGMEGIKYKKGEFKLEKGDLIFLYTDGVTEAINENKVLYGEERLLDAIKKNYLESPEILCNNIKKDLDEFVGGLEQFDDITMLAFRYKGDN